MDKLEIEKYMIYGAEWCGYCKTAVSLASSTGKEVIYIDLTDDEKYINEVKEFYNTRTIPLIMAISTTGLVKRVGGCSDLKEFLS